MEFFTGKEEEVNREGCVFMLMTALKHGESRDTMGNLFCAKGPTFEKLISGFVSVI